MPPESTVAMPPQKNCVASVAMIDGTPTIATSTPLIQPTRAPPASASGTAEPGQLVVLEAHREQVAGERDHRRERQVDLAGRDHERQAEREQEHRRHGREEGQ